MTSGLDTTKSDRVVNKPDVGRWVDNVRSGFESVAKKEIPRGKTTAA